MLLRELLMQLPKDTQDRVADAYRRHNKPLRSALRETLLRFKLAWTRPDGLAHYSCSCPVQLDEAGLPELLLGYRIPDEHRLAALLSLWLPDLRRLQSSARTVDGVVRRLKEELDSSIAAGNPEAARVAMLEQWSRAEARKLIQALKRSQ